MSGYDEQDEQNENGPKALREALEKANKELKALREANEKAQADLAKQSLANVLRDKKVPDSIQKWIKRDEVAPTEEAVDKWLEENGSDFGWKPGGQEASEGAKPEEAPTQGAPAPQASVLSEAEIAAYARVQAALGGTSGAPAIPADQQKAAVDAVASQVNLGYSATNYEDVVRMLRDKGIPMGGNIAY